jgi:hypothetical protein
VAVAAIKNFHINNCLQSEIRNSTRNTREEGEALKAKV